MSPEVLLRFANLTAPRKPGRGPTVHPDPLATSDGAAGALRVSAVAKSDLVGLRKLHRLVVELVDRLLDGRTLEPHAARLTALARSSSAQAQLEVTEGRLRGRLVWSDHGLAAGLARQVVLELGEIDLHRLRRCERAECQLLFYDGTRSNTQRWHAENPCGQRERQRRHRGARGARSV